MSQHIRLKNQNIFSGSRIYHSFAIDIDPLKPISYRLKVMSHFRIKTSLIDYNRYTGLQEDRNKDNNYSHS